MFDKSFERLATFQSKKLETSKHNDQFINFRRAFYLRSSSYLS